jgi:ATP-dependent DNA ligase
MLPEGKMSNEDKMTIDERRKYLRKMKKRYVQATTRREKGQLLDEMEAVTELHRKSLTRLMNGSLERNLVRGNGGAPMVQRSSMP